MQASNVSTSGRKLQQDGTSTAINCEGAAAGAVAAAAQCVATGVFTFGASCVFGGIAAGAQAAQCGQSARQTAANNPGCFPGQLLALLTSSFKLIL